jgi:hypothetical protein
VTLDEQIAQLEAEVQATAEEFARAAHDPDERKAIADELLAQHDLLNCLKSERAAG